MVRFNLKICLILAVSTQSMFVEQFQQSCKQHFLLLLLIVGRVLSFLSFPYCHRRTREKKNKKHVLHWLQQRADSWNSRHSKSWLDLGDVRSPEWGNYTTRTRQTGKHSQRFARLAKTGFELSAMPSITLNCSGGSTVGIALIMAPAMTAIFPAHIYFISHVATGVVWNICKAAEGTWWKLVTCNNEYILSDMKSLGFHRKREENITRTQQSFSGSC